MILAALMVAVPATLLAVGARRLRFWWSWSSGWTVCVLIFDLAITFFISLTSVVVAVKGGWHPHNSDLVTALGPAAAGQLVFRRMGTTRTGRDSIALGLLRFGHQLMDEIINGYVDKWVAVVSSDADLLMDVCALMDVGLANRASGGTRSAWRRAAFKELQSQDGQATREARYRLGNALTMAIVKTQRLRPRLRFDRDRAEFGERDDL